MAKKSTKIKMPSVGAAGAKGKRKLRIDPETLPYRPCVGIMLVNDDGLAFVGRRIGSTDSWQMPQGGIDKGEDTLTAGLRELEEEIGTNNVKVLAVTTEPLRYDLPPDLSSKVWKGKWRGQEQTWVCAHFIGAEDEINLATKHPEFDAWRWVDPETLPDLIVEFKRLVYEAVVREFRPVIAQLKAKDAV